MDLNRHKLAVLALLALAAVAEQLLQAKGWAFAASTVANLIWLLDPKA